MKYLKSKSQMIRLDQLQSVNDMNSRPFTSEAKCHNIDWSYTSSKQQPGAEICFQMWTLYLYGLFTPSASISFNCTIHTKCQHQCPTLALKFKGRFWTKSKASTLTLGVNTALKRNTWLKNKKWMTFLKNTIEPYSIIFLINQWCS